MEDRCIGCGAIIPEGIMVCPNCCQVARRLNQIMTKLESQIIIELAHHQLSALQVSKSLNYHRNTIYYHVRRIQEKTGLNPYDFFDMQKLYPMAREVTPE